MKSNIDAVLHLIRQLVCAFIIVYEIVSTQIIFEKSRSIYQPSSIYIVVSFAFQPMQCMLNKTNVMLNSYYVCWFIKYVF